MRRDSDCSRNCMPRAAEGSGGELRAKGAVHASLGRCPRLRVTQHARGLKARSSFPGGATPGWHEGGPSVLTLIRMFHLDAVLVSSLQSLETIQRHHRSPNSPERQPREVLRRQPRSINIDNFLGDSLEPSTML